MYYHCIDLQKVSASQVHNTGGAKHNLLYNVKKKIVTRHNKNHDKNFFPDQKITKTQQ